MSANREIDAAEETLPLPILCRYMSERSPQPMVAVDGETHITSYVNPAFARLVGKEIEELIGHPFNEAVPEGVENGCLALLDRVYRTGVAEILVEQEHRHSLPGLRHWSYSMWAILGPDERPAGVMLQITDATETALFRKRAVAFNEALLISSTEQTELTDVAELLGARMSDAVRGRDHFIAVLSHELRNPLSAFSSGLELLKLTAGDRDLAETTREMLDRQLQQMVRLVDDLLDVSRIATGKLELHKQQVKLAAIVRVAAEASRALIDEKGHRLTIVLPPAPILLDADPTRLAQVFLNLLNNAAKYTEPGGTIQLTARLEGSEVEVCVQDSGIGVPAAQLHSIFEPFVQVDTSWQRTQGGMGVGLSLVKEFVELHGGRVAVSSAGLGHGCEFRVRLPVVTATVDEPVITVKGPRGPRRRILVVDDNRDGAQSLAMMLKMLGHEVRTAHDGELAVAAAEEYQPVLVLMDLGMPNVDGYEAARRIRKEPWGAEMFLVALTGWGTEEDRRQTQAAGFDQHLVKPVDMAALTTLLVELPSGSR